MRALLLFAFLSTSLLATEYAPWLTPPWEFQGKLSYAYSHTEHVQSPAGSFKYIDNYHEFLGSLAITVWPDINIEAEVGFLQSDTINFSYEVFALTGRKLWLDDLCGDWITLTTGLTMALVPTRILHDFNYAYHGHINAEAHLALGKECRNRYTMDWCWRIWALVGYGIAERGSPWVHGVITFDQSLSDCSRLTLFIETLNGLGGDDIIENVPFLGYGPINHQTIDIGGCYHYDVGIYATLAVLGFINVHAHNFTEHTFGGSVALTIPFGL